MESFERLDFSGSLTHEHEKEIDRFTKYAKEKSESHWDSVSVNYDDIYTKAGYPDPSKIAEHCQKVSTRNDIKKDKAQIIDFGCGTGLVG
jgi:predicted TPR repeat methyltransferase